MEGCYKEKMLALWNLGSCCSFSLEESGWMSVGIHYEAESWLVIGLFERLFSCQRVFLGVWNELSGHILAGCKVDICVDSCFFGCHSSVAFH